MCYQFRFAALLPDRAELSSARPLARPPQGVTCPQPATPYHLE